MTLKVYAANDFQGHYPVGTAAVIIAPDLDTARRMLLAKLNAMGLPQHEPIEIVEVPLHAAGVIILNDGDY